MLDVQAIIVASQFLGTEAIRQTIVQRLIVFQPDDIFGFVLQLNFKRCVLAG